MEASSNQQDDRRRAIADSGVRIIARDGIRALTHRAVDKEADIPQGATSHLARTRRALIDLIAGELESRTFVDAESFLEPLATRKQLGPDDVVAMITSVIDHLTDRPTDMRARYALLIEHGDDSALRLRLTTGAGIHDVARQAISRMLALAGLDDTAERAGDIVALIDSLVFYEIATDNRGATRDIVATYVRGITRATKNPGR